MKKSISNLLMILSCFLIFFNCTKKAADISNASNTKKIITEEQQLIYDAEDYFNKEVDGKIDFNIINGVTPDFRQKLNKTPLWNEAYIAESNKGNIIVVPLKYEKHVSQKNSLSGGLSSSLEKNTKFFINKDATGNFHAEVVTLFPDKEMISNTSKYFTGFLLVEDWAGNTIKKNLYKDGKVYSIKNTTSNSGSNFRIVCTTIDWYLCDVEEDGTLSNCSYVSSTNLGCADEEGHAVPDPESGGQVEYEILAYSTLSKQVDWIVAQQSQGLWTVWSTETLKGIHSGNSNHFTGITHQGDLIVGEGMLWELNGNTLNYNYSTATSSVSGKATTPLGTEFFIPTQIKSWNSSVVFP